MMTGFEPETRWVRLSWNPCTPLLRRVFHLDALPVKATLHATALGMVDCFLNGEPVGGERLAPGWIDYRRAIPLRSHDVTPLLRLGENVLGAILGNGIYAGFWGPFEDKGFYGNEAWFAAELHLEFSGGRRQVVATDADWRATEGPILRSDVLTGEEVDARKEETGWELPGFDAAHWKPVRCLETPPDQPLIVRDVPPVIEQDILAARSLGSPKPGVQVFDLGQNMTGHVRLKVDLPAGTRLTIRHGERLNPDGTVYTGNLRQARATDVYISDGKGEAVWQPRFTFHGFQYVAIEGAGCELPDDAVAGVVLSVFPQSTARFECGIPDVERLMRNIDWTIRSNCLFVPTDCNQRDERQGWCGDACFALETAACMHDANAFYAAWLDELNAAQFANGAYPDYAPYMGRVGGGHAGWGDAGVIVPWTIYWRYGNIEPARRHWKALRRWMDFIDSPNNSHNGPEAGIFGDWLHVDDPISMRCMGVAFHAYDCDLMARLAVAVGQPAEALVYHERFERVRRQFQEMFVAPDGVIDSGSQSAYVLALRFGLLESDQAAQAAEHLVARIAERGNRLSTGIVAAGHLLPVLSDIGRSDLAYTLLLNRENPSWLYPIEQGATTVWERWDSWTPESGFADERMNSFNHPAFASVGAWLFGYAAGIRPLTPGFGQILIAPSPDARLGQVKARMMTPHGSVEAGWVLDGGNLDIQWDLPPGKQGLLENPWTAERKLITGKGCLTLSGEELATGHEE